MKLIAGPHRFERSPGLPVPFVRMYEGVLQRSGQGLGHPQRTQAPQGPGGEQCLGTTGSTGNNRDATGHSLKQYIGQSLPETGETEYIKRPKELRHVIDLPKKVKRLRESHPVHSLPQFGLQLPTPGDKKLNPWVVLHHHCGSA
jgi:hypothetical protein